MADDTFLVLEPGAFTTIQDLGRFGYQTLGVPISGAMDSYSASAANILAGNSQTSAVLEMTIQGCTLAVMRNARVALTGARAGIRHNSMEKPPWSAFEVEPGDVLRISQVSLGCRIYMAVDGGFDVPLVMGSRSTYAQAALGGHKGRALQKGDFLPAGKSGKIPAENVIPEEFIPEMGQETELCCVAGPQEHMFRDKGRDLFTYEYTVTQRADRRGIRLEGPQIEHSHQSPGAIVSEPILPGNIQVPADGQPIILLREQTTGGYPKIATVISSDLPKLGRIIPGDKITFRAVTVEQARDKNLKEQEWLRSLQKMLWQKS
ncbi:MAG: biotin-dependent carboxyltransferase family protein [Thermodesulfobacteriota bacterium]